MKQENYIIQAVDESIDILLLLCVPEYQPHTEQEIVNALEIKRNKVFRVLKTLEKKGLVRTKNKYWEVTPKIVDIAYGFRRYISRKRSELEELEIEYRG